MSYGVSRVTGVVSLCATTGIIGYFDFLLTYFKLSKMETKGKLLGVTIDGKYYPCKAENSITTPPVITPSVTIEVKNGEADFYGEFRPDGEENYQPIKIVMSTKIPDGIYDPNDITFEVSDGIRDPDFPLGCYVLHTKEYAKKHNIPVLV